MTRLVWRGVVIYLLTGVVAAQLLMALDCYGVHIPWLTRLCSAIFEWVFVVLFGIW